MEQVVFPIFVRTELTRVAKRCTVTVFSSHRDTLGNDNGTSYGDKCVRTFTRYQREKARKEKRKETKKKKKEKKSNELQGNNVEGLIVNFPLDQY